MPPPRMIHGRIVALIPIAPSMPCTGNGVNVSQSRKPALRTFSAPWISASGLGYSASSPCSGAGPFAFFVFGWLISVPPVRVRVLGLHFGHGDDGQVAA